MRARARCRSRRLIVATVMGLCVLGAAPPARADAESDAKDLFQRARSLRLAGNCGDATPLFRKAHSLYPLGLGSLRNVAECEEELGHYASARRAWLDIKRALLTMPKDPKYEGWEKDGEDAARRLEPKIATMQIDVIVRSPEAESPANEKTGIEVFINGESVGPKVVGTPLERDPGSYTIRVQLEHARPVERDVVLVAGDSQRVTLRLVQEPPEGRLREIDVGSGKRNAGWVLLGVGGAALVASAVTFAMRASAKSELESGCPTLVNCDRSLIDTQDRGQTMSTLTSILFPAGLVLAGAGAGLLIWGYNSKEMGRAPHAKGWTVAPGVGRLDATVRF